MRIKKGGLFLKKSIILKVLAELDKSNKLLSKEDLELNENVYNEILEILYDVRFVKGITLTPAGDKYIIHTDNPRITLSGIEYLDSNTNGKLIELSSSIERLASTIERGSFKFF